MAPTNTTTDLTGELKMPTRKTKAPAFPLTTKGKITQAAAKAAKAAKAENRVKKVNMKGPKLRSFPPPEEGLADLELTRPKAVRKRVTEPLTTQQKIHAAQAAEEAKALKAKAAAVAPPKPIKSKSTKPANGSPAMMNILGNHSATVYEFAAKPSGTKHPRTQRAEKYLRERRETALKDLEIRTIWEDQTVQNFLQMYQKNPRALQVLHSKKESTGVEMQKKFRTLVFAGVVALPPLVGLDGVEQPAFQLMKLPGHVRAAIFSLVVVEPKVFIRPADSRIGRQQPDLAMVNRQVRNEVLPLFYGQNTFVIDISPSAVRDAGKSKRGSGMFKKMSSSSAPAFATVSKWAETLEKGGWFGMIKRWVFDYAPPGSWQMGTVEDNSAMISVTFARRAYGRATWNAVVEVHREAACIMPGFSEHGLCIVGRVPEWLNEAVIEVADAAGRGTISGSMIISLAEKIKAGAYELDEVRCEQQTVMKSIEMGPASLKSGSIGGDSGFGGE